MDVADAVWRLSKRLPVTDRQLALPPELRAVHRFILHSFLESGRPPQRAEIAQRISARDGKTAITELAENDLVVRGEDGEIVGAYPFTMADTPHRLLVRGWQVNAMCALDALAVGPMFAEDVVIDSSCEVTGDRIHIEQRGREIAEVEPSAQIHVGIHWPTGEGPAAATL